jgi:hypothetical protein
MTCWATASLQQFRILHTAMPRARAVAIEVTAVNGLEIEKDTLSEVHETTS